MKRQIVFFSLWLSSPLVFAQIPVTDGINAIQNTISAMESVTQTAQQLQQYKNQIEQLQYQIQNTKNPGSFSWDNAQALMYKIRGMVFQIDGLKNKAGGMQGYLDNYQDSAFYKNAACNSQSGCTSVQAASLMNSSVIGSTERKKANDAAFKGLDLQQQQIQDDANTLATLQQNAQSSQGQMQALQAANQLASEQAQQLLQIRSLMVQEQQGATVAAQIEADKQAQQTASAIYSLQGNFYSSPSKKWNP